MTFVKKDKKKKKGGMTPTPSQLRDRMGVMNKVSSYQRAPECTPLVTPLSSGYPPY